MNKKELVKKLDNLKKIALLAHNSGILEIEIDNLIMKVKEAL